MLSAPFIAYICVLIAALIPYVFTVLAKTGPGFSNKAPREYFERITGWRKRAHWTQVNGFEAFGPFAAAVIMAHTSHAPQLTINILALVFILSRILHGIFYITNRSSLRTLTWFVGFTCVIILFILSIMAIK